MKKSLITLAFFLVGAFIIQWLRLKNIDLMKGPYIFPDQLGYYTHAAILSGLPWYQTTDTWYSFGVSLVMAGIMRITHDAASIYRFCIYANTIVSEIGYILGFILIRQIAKKISVNYAWVISAVASCCSAYVFQAQLVWAETYVYTLFMLVLVLAALYAKKPNLFRAILLAVSVGVLFIFHNRTLVVFVAACGYVFFTAFADKKIFRMTLQLVIVCAILLAAYKGNSSAKFWFLDREGKIETSADANSVIVSKTAVSRDVRPDFGGFDFDGEYGGIPIHDFVEENNENALIGRLGNAGFALEDPMALLGMVESLLGSFWYLLISTLGLAGFGTIYILRKMISGFKRGSVPEDRLMSCFYLFVFLCFIATLAETGYNAMWYPEYTLSNEGSVYWEMLFYGRYVELLTMPLIIFGALDILESTSRKYMIVECVAVAVLFVATSLMIIAESIQLYGQMINIVCVPGIYGLLSFDLILSCIIVLLAGAVVYVLLKGKRTKFVCTIGILGFFYINAKPAVEYNNESQIILNGYNEVAEVLNNNPDVQVAMDSTSVLRDRYYRLRTQAIESKITYDEGAYWDDEGDMIYLVGEDSVEEFVSYYSQDNLKVLYYGNYPMIIRGAQLQERLMQQGYELE